MNYKPEPGVLRELTGIAESMSAVARQLSDLAKRRRERRRRILRFLWLGFLVSMGFVWSTIFAMLAVILG